MLGEAALLYVIITTVAYTEIDYATYLAQKNAVLAGELDYSKIHGPQGPLVYPAGHVWLYAIIDSICQGSVEAAQRLFAVMYVLDVYVVARIYRATFFPSRTFPPILLALLALSKRAHSVFALRLFNDGPCALLSHAAVLLFVQSRDTAACVVYSLACSVKMSALLYAPAVYVGVQRGEGPSTRKTPASRRRETRAGATRGQKRTYRSGNDDPRLLRLRATFGRAAVPGGRPHQLHAECL